MGHCEKPTDHVFATKDRVYQACIFCGENIHDLAKKYAAPPVQRNALNQLEDALVALWGSTHARNKIRPLIDKLRTPSPSAGAGEMNNNVLILSKLPLILIQEIGMKDYGVSITRAGIKGGSLWRGTVGEFLSIPNNQSGSWFIDGGWGGPPGPIRVDWDGKQWINKGFPPHEDGFETGGYFPK